MINARNLKNEIRRTHSVEDLRRIFGKKLDDAMFARVGRTLMNADALPEDKKHLPVWAGYEFLIDFTPFC